MAQKRRYYTVLPSAPASTLCALAQQAESMGLEGVWSPQVYNNPFLPLAAVAASTQRLQLATAVALAFVRSPLETAQNAIDLDRLSGGRFTLGLGTSIRHWNESWYGVEYSERPVARLRECVEVIRLVIAKAHQDEPLHFQGRFYNLRLDDYRPPPPLRENLPIVLASLVAIMARTAAEIADCVIGHPMCSERWLREEIGSAVAEGLRRSGRERKNFNVGMMRFVAISSDREQARRDAAGTVGFYAAMEQYEPYFSSHGFQAEAHRLHELYRQSDFGGMVETMPDEMVSTFAIYGTANEARRRVDQLWEHVDCLCLVPPYFFVPPDRFMQYAMAINETLYTP